MTVVLEQHVAAAHGRDVEVRVAVVVDVGKGRGDADLSGNSNTRGRSDLLELAAAGVPPQLIAAHLTDEVDVEQSVAVDIGHGEAVAMVVVRRLVRLARVVNDPVFEGNVGLGQVVRELETVKRLHVGEGLDLGLAEGAQPGRVAQIFGDVANDRIRPRRSWWRGRGRVQLGADAYCCRRKADDDQRRGKLNESGHVSGSAKEGPLRSQYRTTPMRPNVTLDVSALRPMVGLRFGLARVMRRVHAKGGIRASYKNVPRSDKRYAAGVMKVARDQ